MPDPAALLVLIPVKEAGKKDDGFNRSGSREFLAAFTPAADAVFVRDNLGIAINYPHPSDAGMVVTLINVDQNPELSQLDNPLNLADPNNGRPCYWWAVTIDYGPWNPLEHTATGSPVDQPIDFSFQWQVFEQAVDVAVTPGTTTYVPVLNSAGDPFDPPVVREQLKGIMRVAWNSLAFNPVPFFTFGNYINNDVWNGFPAGSIKFSPPNMPQRLYSQFLGRTYYRLEAEFSFNPNDGGWNARPIDRGFRALDSSGRPFKILDVNAQPISQPALLNGSGGVLVSGGAFFQQNFQVYPDTAFATAFPNLTNLFA